MHKKKKSSSWNLKKMTRLIKQVLIYNQNRENRSYNNYQHPQDTYAQSPLEMKYSKHYYTFHVTDTR